MKISVNFFQNFPCGNFRLFYIIYIYPNIIWVKRDNTWIKILININKFLNININKFLQFAVLISNNHESKHIVRLHTTFHNISHYNSSIFLRQVPSPVFCIRTGACLGRWERMWSYSGRDFISLLLSQTNFPFGRD